MFNLRSLAIAAAVLLLCAPLLAQDLGVPDTVYFGDQGKAFGYSGGVYRVPVYVTTDQEIYGICLGMEFGINSSGQIYDSLSIYGSILMGTNYLDLGGMHINLNSLHPPNPDTVLFGGAAQHHPLPVGRYKFCDIFFHGANIGETVEVDSAWVPPAGPFTFASGTGSNYTPRFVGGMLTIVSANPELISTLPAQINGTSGTTLSFTFSVAATYEPSVTVFDSLRPAIALPAAYYPPMCPSGNPVTFTWPTLYYEFGTWHAYFTATDALQNRFPLATTISLAMPVANMGDVNCDGIINVTDAVGLINFIFVPGTPAPCTGK